MEIVLKDVHRLAGRAVKEKETVAMAYPSSDVDPDQLPPSSPLLRTMVRETVVNAIGLFGAEEMRTGNNG